MAIKNLKEIIAEVKTSYEGIGRVFCPILNSYIHFNSEGFNHLIYKSNRKKRNVKEQLYKLRLFKLVIPAIKNSKVIEEWRFMGETGNPNDIQFYAITHKCGKKPVPIRVIIKRAGDGEFNYHSVMGFWKKKKPRKKTR